MIPLGLWNGIMWPCVHCSCSSVSELSQGQGNIWNRHHPVGVFSLKVWVSGMRIPLFLSIGEWGTQTQVKPCSSTDCSRDPACSAGEATLSIWGLETKAPVISKGNSSRETVQFLGRALHGLVNIRSDKITESSWVSLGLCSTAMCVHIAVDMWIFRFLF